MDSKSLKNMGEDHIVNKQTDVNLKGETGYTPLQ
jgi:hypothetical protein